MCKAKRGLIVGRFQPFHLGHANVIQRILKKEEELVIGIGSVQESFTLENPLTGGERIEMIRTFLRKHNLVGRIIIVPIPDIEENFVWPARVKEYTPSFRRVYSGNELVLSLFETMNIQTTKLEMVNRKEYEGTYIRKKVIRGEKWQQLVPDSILPVLKNIGFSKRIKRLSSWYMDGEGEK